jgi:hypothetical protein
MLIAQESAVEKRRIVLEQRFQERGQFHDAIERIGHAVSAANAEIDRRAERFAQHP